MAIFGYGRVSSKSQNPDRQIKALKEKGVSDNRIFVDMESGRTFDRPLLPVPENFAEVYEEWEGKHISGQKAAELLGVSADTFRRWREKYRMEPDTFMSSSEG